MNATEIRKEIHDYIDLADDRFLRSIYSMIENEHVKANSKTTNEMVNRAKASMASVAEGRTRDITSFSKEVDEWKKQKATR